ncbi:MAG: YcjX family protein [Succinivibrionaceae bacterium]
MSFFSGISNSLVNGIQQFADLAFDREIRIGVTGLSRGGKTAFFTSLIGLFENFSESNAQIHLPRFTALGDRGIFYGGLVDNPDLSVPRFPYADALGALRSDPPCWPEPTDSVSQVKIELRYRDDRFYIPGKSRSLYLTLYDYPGEWLVDILLLNLTYQEFSSKVAELAEKFRPAADPSSWINLGSALDPDDPVDEVLLSKTVKSYRQWLLTLKNKGFSLVIPGRFIMPGTLQGAPVIEFLPWVWDKKVSVPAPAGSIYQIMEERYETYKEKVVKRFYEDYFKKLDRQIILVDCFRSLLGGRMAYDDLNETLDVLLSNFSYGESSLLSRLFAPKIDKVLFAATKADLVTVDQYDRLLNILKTMVSQSCRRIKKDIGSCEFLLLSAIRSTRCVETRYQGSDIQILKTDYEEDGRFFPGDLPPDWSEESIKFFQEHFCYHQELRPPRTNPGEILPHINMDLMLQKIIGDRL